MDPITQKNVEMWLKGDYDEETKSEIRNLLKTHPEEIIDSFYTDLKFGTGGLRGIMGVGSNRMNNYTVRAATQGLANYLNQQAKPSQGHSVFIGFDSRHHSKQFAEESAKVLAGNGIKVYLFSDLRPTPLVSFGVRYKQCSAGIMITASHNPPDYNGYKVYWNDGAQVLPPHDVSIIAEVEKITDLKQIKTVGDLNHPLIEKILESVDKAYLEAIFPLQFYPKVNQKEGKNLKVVYTSLHGTGITLVPKALQQAGFSQIAYVDSQIIPDGNFPTAHFPNPEEKEALKLGVEKLKAIDGDILIATDPDADRIGVVIHKQGDIQALNGNQMACICLHHILEALTQQERLPPRAAFIKTIVTTELFKVISHAYKRECFDVLTGFKYVAEKIRQWEQEPNGFQYIFGGEESYGYLLGTQTRDKDAITISVLACEAALKAKMQRKNLVDVLNEIYQKYGLHLEKLLSVKFEESKAGREQIEKSIERLQKNPPTEIKGIPVVALEDYQKSIKTYLKDKKTERITLPKSEVLIFWLEDGSKLIIRPSGTEPKIKIYGGFTTSNFKSIQDGEVFLNKHADELLEALRQDLMR